MIHNNFPRSFASGSRDGLMSKEDNELLNNILPRKINENKEDIKYLKGLHDVLRDDHDQLREEYDILHEEHDVLRDDHDQLREEHDVLRDDHDQLREEHNTHVNDKNNPHKVTKAQVGLGNADNTSDLNKPLSNAAVNRINEVEDLANLALQTARDKVSAIPFDTKADLDAWLAKPENVASLKIGTSFYIREAETPDYWWDGTKPQILETQKVDLSNYLTLSGNGSNTTVTFTEASSLSKITSGSKLSTLFGTVSKAVSDLISLINKVGTTDISGIGSTVTAAISNISTSYVKKSGDTMTGALTGTSAIFSGTLKANNNTKTPFNVDNGLNFVNKAVEWNTSSYIQHVILLIPVLTANNQSAMNYIDGKFLCWKTGGNVYDVVEANLNCCYNSLRYYLQYYGDHTGWKLCVCRYGGIYYYALKCPYHANPYYYVEFIGHIKSELNGGTNTVSLPLDVPYYDDNSSTVLNSEVYNSITDTLTTTYVTSVSSAGLYVPSGFVGDLSGNANTATVAAKLGRNGDTSIPMTFYWSGQSGQPSWLWGGSDGTNMYVYNPSNFNVATAVALTSSAGAATVPIYFSGGKPVACTYSLGADVLSYAGSLTSGGWKTLGGRSSGSKISVAYNSGAAAWNSETYSASLVFGCADTKGLLDCGYSSPIVTFGGASVGGSTDNAPKWYFKLSGTNGATYTLPSTSGTLSLDGHTHNYAGSSSAGGDATNADKLDGYHGSSSATANTYVLRDSNGYIFSSYINSSTSNNENPGISQIIVTNGSDNYYRKASLAHLKSALGAMTPASHTHSYLPLSGGTMSGTISMNGNRIGVIAGTYNATASTRYSSSALEIRENALVGSAQSDISYAPTIGFHWGGRVAATLAMDSAGTFNFIVQAGNGYSAINCGTINSSGTITGTKVYNAIWNDYAEWFEKENLEEEFEPGDIVSWGENGVTKSSWCLDTMVVGVYSDSYGHIIGGEQLDDMEDNIKKHIPVGLAGRLYIKVTGKVKRGDLIVSSDIPGVGMAQDRSNIIPGTIIGKALENKDSEDTGKIKILIMLS